MDQLPRLRKRELICLLLLICNYVGSVSLGAWDGLCYFIVALPEPLYNYFVQLIITKTSPCNEYPLTSHFYMVKLGFTGVYTLF